MDDAGVEVIAAWPDPVGRLVRRIQASFRGGHRSGVVQFDVQDDEALSFHAHVGDAVDFVPGRHPAPEACIALDAAALGRLAADDAAEFHQGMRPSGDRGLLALLAQALAGDDSEGLVRLALLETVIASQRPYPREIERLATIRPGDLLRALRAGRPLVLTGQ